MPRSPDKRWPSPSEREDRNRRPGMGPPPYTSSSSSYDSRYGYKRDERRYEPPTGRYEDERNRRSWTGRSGPVLDRERDRRDVRPEYSDNYKSAYARDNPRSSSSIAPAPYRSTSPIPVPHSHSRSYPHPHPHSQQPPLPIQAQHQHRGDARIGNTRPRPRSRSRSRSPSVHTEDEGYSTEEGMITPKKAKPKDLPPVMSARDRDSYPIPSSTPSKSVEMSSKMNLGPSKIQPAPAPDLEMEAEAGEIREEVLIPPVAAPIQLPAQAREDPALGLDLMNGKNERSPIKLNGTSPAALDENVNGKGQDRADPTDLERGGTAPKSAAVPLPSPRSPQPQLLHGSNHDRTRYIEDGPDSRRREEEREYEKDVKSLRNGRSSPVSRSRSRSPRAVGRAPEVAEQGQTLGQGRDPRRSDLPVQVPLAPRADRYSAQTATANQRRSRSPVRAPRSPIPRPLGRTRSRSRSRSRSSRSTSSRSRSRSRSRSSTRSRKIPTAPKGPRNFNPPTGPSGRGGFVPRGGYRGRGAGYQYAGYVGRGGYAAPAWGGRYPAATGTGVLPAGPAADRLPPSTPSGPSSERERDREREERERARDAGQTPVVGKWAARKAQDAVARTPDAGQREEGRPPLSSSPVRTTETAARDYRSAREVERSPLPDRNGGEAKRAGLTRQDTGVSSIGSVKREHVALPPAIPAQPRQEVRISLTQASKPVPDMERKLSAVPSISTPKSMASPLQIEGERKMQQVQSPLGSSVPSRPITPIPQTAAVKQESTQQGPSSRPSSSHAQSTQQQQQAQPQLQNPQPQRTRSHRHVDRSWRGYPAPKDITARPRQISEVLVHVPDSDKMEVDASEDTGAVIRIRTREAVPGTEHLDAELMRLRHERDKMHYAFQSQAASLRWNRFDVALAEQELEAARRKTQAAGMMYFSPETLGPMSPLPQKRE